MRKSEAAINPFAVVDALVYLLIWESSIFSKAVQTKFFHNAKRRTFHVVSRLLLTILLNQRGMKQEGYNE